LAFGFFENDAEFHHQHSFLAQQRIDPRFMAHLMTLNVSLRVPDGIVLASDSLATLMQQINQKVNVQTTCDKCGNQIDLKDVPAPPVSIPSSTWPYAQKMFPIQGRFGLATWGSGIVNNRSIYNHVIELNPTIPKPQAGEDPFEQISGVITKYFGEQLIAEWKRIGIDPALQPDDFFPFGFQLVGFTKDQNGDPVPNTYLIFIGKKPKVDKFNGIGWAWSGDGTVVTRLLQGGTANFAAFSLQDAIDYAKFLIRTTADFQRFSGKLPTVGGDIDVALVTNHRGFRWIAQKELYRILDREDKIP
jgi:hypothetical protein